MTRRFRALPLVLTLGIAGLSIACGAEEDALLDAEAVETDDAAVVGSTPIFVQLNGAVQSFAHETTGPNPEFMALIVPDPNVGRHLALQNSKTNGQRINVCGVAFCRGYRANISGSIRPGASNRLRINLGSRTRLCTSSADVTARMLVSTALLDGTACNDIRL